MSGEEEEDGELVLSPRVAHERNESGGEAELGRGREEERREGREGGREGEEQGGLVFSESPLPLL